MSPQEIEHQSFTIIEQEAGPHSFTPEEWSIVRRIIHTTADFEYMTSIRFQSNAIQMAKQAIQSGTKIITDTRMALSGIQKKAIEAYGGEVVCYIDDSTVQIQAQKHGTTRARMAIDMAVQSISGGIYVIGNAPTALLRLIELVQQNSAKPDVVIAFPVGFVNAAESKAELLALNIPLITNIGRKGGSTVAASVMNALIQLTQNN
ncbi:MAG: precorrin-8X methylmutase [Desulfobacterales bacterium]|nr:precorrin-8X methylmutase [Desulfobacterales bacterium]